MTGNILMNNGMTYAAWATDILNGLLADIVEQDKLSYAYQEDLKAKMLFKETKALNPEQTFSEAVWAYETDEINEGQSLPIIDVEKWPNKGFEVIPYGNKLKITKLFMKRLETNQTIATADSYVQQYYSKLASALINLNRWAIKRGNMQMVKLLASGWTATNAHWAGSATAYGKALFATDHPIMDSTASFSNVLNQSGQTVNKALSATSLQWALDNMKVQIKLQNGDFVDNVAGIYELRVPRALEQTARVVLQSKAGNRYMFAGTGSNSALLNTFDFDGNKVELKVLPTMWALDKNGATIWASTYWFLVNPEAIKLMNGFRFITLWDKNIESHYDFDSKNYFSSIDMAFGVEHLWAQYWIIWSQGTS